MDRRASSRRGARDRGAAAVEFALLLPLLLLIVFGIIDFGRALNAQITLTQAAREGARLDGAGPAERGQPHAGRRDRAEPGHRDRDRLPGRRRARRQRGGQRPATRSRSSRRSARSPALFGGRRLRVPDHADRPGGHAMRDLIARLARRVARRLRPRRAGRDRHAGRGAARRRRADGDGRPGRRRRPALPGTRRAAERRRRGGPRRWPRAARLGTCDPAVAAQLRRRQRLQADGRERPGSPWSAARAAWELPGQHRRHTDCPPPAPAPTTWTCYTVHADRQRLDAAPPGLRPHAAGQLQLHGHHRARLRAGRVGRARRPPPPRRHDLGLRVGPGDEPGDPVRAVPAVPAEPAARLVSTRCSR